jgi:hypothetical protein
MGHPIAIASDDLPGFLDQARRPATILVAFELQRRNAQAICGPMRIRRR